MDDGFFVYYYLCVWHDYSSNIMDKFARGFLARLSYISREGVWVLKSEVLINL